MLAAVQIVQTKVQTVQTKVQIVQTKKMQAVQTKVQAVQTKSRQNAHLSTLVKQLIINTLRRKVQSVDKIRKTI